MADSVGQWVDVPSQAAAGQWEDIPNPSPPKSFTDHLGDFAGHTWDALTGSVKGTAGAVMHPIDTASSILRDAADEIGKGKQAYEKGDYDRAAEHFKYALPVAGPLLRQMRQETDAGDYGAALGDITGTVLGGKLLARVPELPGAAKAAAALPAKAVEFARTPGNMDLVAGAAKVAGGTGALAHGVITANPYTALGGGAAVIRGLENIGNGLEKRSASAPAPAVAPIDPILDQIAQSTSGKKFAALDPAAQATVQKIAEAANKPAAPAPTAAPPPPQPEAPPPAAAAPTPTPPAAPAAPAAVAPATENPGAAAFAARARAPKVSTLADTLHQGDISAEDAARLTPGDWQRLSRGLGINNPSPYTITAVLDELRSREAAAELAKSQEGVQRAADLRSKAEAARRAKVAPPPPVQ